MFCYWHHIQKLDALQNNKVYRFAKLQFASKLHQLDHFRVLVGDQWLIRLLRFWIQSLVYLPGEYINLPYCLLESKIFHSQVGKLLIETVQPGYYAIDQMCQKCPFFSTATYRLSHFWSKHIKSCELESKTCRMIFHRYMVFGLWSLVFYNQDFVPSCYCYC